MTTSHGSRVPDACSRRQFLRLSSGACAALTLVPAHVIRGEAQPSRKITLAGVGVGGVGHGQLQECAKAGFQIVALCDVDATYARKSFDLWPQARRYKDFREMLASEGDKIDGVYCGTPDHTHALITVAALRRKKHVCCVKPLTRTIRELRAVVEEAQRAGVATQVTASPNTTEPGCRTTEIIDAGVLGPVRELHVWSNRPVWPQGMTRPPGEDPIPKDLDWKLWLGPAPIRPFKNVWHDGDYALTQMNLKDWDPGVKGVYHPFNFRGWWDFGTGALGDMGCHHFNTPFRALRLGAPAHVQASATKVLSETAPLASIVTLEFPARGSFPSLQATWYDGGLKPPQPVELSGQPWPSEGTLYIGEHGLLLSTWEGIKVAPDAAAKRSEGVARTLPRREGTWKEWFLACQGGEPAGCNFSWAGPLTEAVLLGNAAIRAGKRLEWDSTRLQFTNAGDADRLLGEPYQNGWTLERM
ncbi:MAG TPA: Gfo/Idh/MocA family oxidoreductase [Verrucomicrobiae bacterium]